MSCLVIDGSAARRVSHTNDARYTVGTSSSVRQRPLDLHQRDQHRDQQDEPDVPGYLRTSD